MIAAVQPPGAEHTQLVRICSACNALANAGTRGYAAYLKKLPPLSVGRSVIGVSTAPTTFTPGVQ